MVDVSGSVSLPKEEGIDVPLRSGYNTYYRMDRDVVGRVENPIYYRVYLHIKANVGDLGPNPKG